MNTKKNIDISENEILNYDESILTILLTDRTTRQNIIWGTTDYETYGNEYKSHLPIKIILITGNNKNIIQPRICKIKNKQTIRTKDRAEVFTPSWTCNIQNNLIDTSWFGRDSVFNIAKNKSWVTNEAPIKFSSIKGKNWKDYVDTKRLEITCGEAPYLVSRYDSVSGRAIKVKDRIGLLDRKLRVVSENTTSEEEWLKWATRAFQSIYGFEFQGDNLLLARENCLYTFIDFFEEKFKKHPEISQVKNIAKIISWNIWQMDGIHFTVPSLINSECNVTDLNQHSATEEIFCKIKDWRANKTITYKSLIQEKEV